MLSLPEGVLEVPDPDTGEFKSLTCIGVWITEINGHDYWSWTTFGDVVLLAESNILLEDLAKDGWRGDPTVDEETYQKEAAFADFDYQPTRDRIGNLIVNTCLAMEAERELLKRPSSGKKGKRGFAKMASNRHPQRWTFGRKLDIDMEYTRQYLRGNRGKGSPVKVRSLVRGHYRWQVCGKRNQERKRIWIKPFWRGPEDGPVLVRQVHLNP